MRFKHSRMHRDNRAPGISKPSRGPGPSPNPLKNLLPNRNRKTQRKLRPDPLITTLRLRPIMILSSNKVLPSDPGDPIELTTRHYPYPFLPYSPSFWPRKDPNLPVFCYIKAFQPSRDVRLDAVDKWIGSR